MRQRNEVELLTKLFEFADKNRVTFHPAQDILRKVKMMASTDNRCICKPNERKCPCNEAIKELEIEGKCTCMLFCTYKYGDEYLNKWGYLKDGIITSDKERKEIVKKKTEKKE